MNKDTMIRNYRKFSASDSYILGFVYQHKVYAIKVAEIMPRYIKVEHESTKKGGKPKLQLRLNKLYQEQLIRKGAFILGDEEILNGEYNKGVEFERLIYQYYHQEWIGKNNIGFWEQGDIEVNHEKIQIKLNGGQIALESTLKRLQKKARAG